ncbi:MAG: hypothetical protein P1U85_09660 [Verrucomicrobiales bacterium]|nr:hypothetical protein [Verrucomicrobiales bacterium]
MKKLFSLFVFLLLAGSQVHAQIQAELKLDRSLYIAHEPITATLTIVNRAGQDLIFGDTNGMSWLDFSITDNRGHLITPVRRGLNERPIVLSAGQTYKHKVVINKRYPMAKIGIYRVKASITFPQINRVFDTKPVSVQVTDGQSMWSQIVGVPQGYPGAGTYREYSLMTYYHGARNRALYFRLKNSDSGQVLKTYPLGDYMEVRKPQYLIDRQNQLHVLHLSAPKVYKYTIIGVDGDPVRQLSYFEKGTNRPILKGTEYGEVSVVGGFTEEEMKTPYEQSEFRRLSERPPGMPNF